MHDLKKSTYILRFGNGVCRDPLIFLNGQRREAKLEQKAVWIGTDFCRELNSSTCRITGHFGHFLGF
jgi:hypothetical protein